MVQASEHGVDFLYFLIVPTMDFVEKSPTLPPRREALPFIVGFGDLLLGVDELKSPHNNLAASQEPVSTNSVPRGFV